MIRRFPFTESRALLKLHTSSIFQWANNENVTVLSPIVREALLTSIARLHEIVEGMEVTKGKPVPKNKEGETLN